MRFNTVEVEEAYEDYLDSLEDWPPPEDQPALDAAPSLSMRPDLDALKSLRHSTSS